MVVKLLNLDRDDAAEQLPRSKALLGLLIEHKADVNKEIRTERGSTDGLIAARKWSTGRWGWDDGVAILGSLVHGGADVNRQVPNCWVPGHTALLAALIWFSHDDTAVRVLVEAGTDVDMEIRYGEHGSPLTAAASNGSLELLNCSSKPSRLSIYRSRTGGSEALSQQLSEAPASNRPRWSMTWLKCCVRLGQM